MYRTVLMLAALAVGFAATAEVRWLADVYDFGAFDEVDSLKTATFRFVNDGSEDVAITSATATCGCTTPRYNVDPVHPGDTATINVAYDPVGRPGRFEKYVYIRTSDGTPRKKLTIRGTVVGSPATIAGRYPVDMGPLRLKNGAVMIGKVLKGRAKMEFADGYNASLSDISPVVTGAPNYLNVTVNPATVAPGEQVLFNVYFRADRCPLYGIVTDTIMVRPTPDAEAYALPVIAIVEEDFSKLTPGQLQKAPEAVLKETVLDLGTLDGDKPLTASAELVNRGQDKLIIRRVYSSDPGITVRAASNTVKKGKSTSITVTYDPVAAAAAGAPRATIVNARVTIITNSPSNPTITLRVAARP